MKSLPQTQDEARAVVLLRALANPVRYRIVQILSNGECVAGDLTDQFPLSQSSVSEHLKVLKDAGIVQGTVEGPNRCYCLDPGAIAYLREMFDSIESRACC